MYINQDYYYQTDCNVIDPFYRKLEQKHCFYDKYESYNTLEDAKFACTLDSNCGGVYDPGCNTEQYFANNYSLCPLKSVYRKSGSSCTYHKLLPGKILCFFVETMY